MKKETAEKYAQARKIEIKSSATRSMSDSLISNSISPYIIALQATNFQISLLVSLPAIFGKTIQVYASKIIEKLSRKKIVLFGELLQAAMIILIAIPGIMFFFLGISSSTSSYILIAIYLVYALSASISIPASASWIRDISKTKRAIFLAKKNKIKGIFGITTTIVLGIILDISTTRFLFTGFAIIFAIAFIIRIYTIRLVSRQYEPKISLEKGYYFSLKQFLKKMPYNNFGRFTIFLSLANFSIAIASPFFAVYMLRNLEFSYIQYMTMIIVFTFSSIFFIPKWGKMVERFGSLKIFEFSGIFIALSPFLWLASFLFTGNPTTAFIYILIVQMFSGFATSGFSISSINFIYDAVTSQRMGICAAYQNIILGAGIFLGATIGGIIATIPEMQLGFSPFVIVFIVSGVARFVSFSTIGKFVKEVRKVDNFKAKKAREKIGMFLGKFQ